MQWVLSLGQSIAASWETFLQLPALHPTQGVSGLPGKWVQCRVGVRVVLVILKHQQGKANIEPRE